ncbi:MAG: hypothetical protein R6W73_06790 [Candidatus Saliniplasma sp.]
MNEELAPCEYKISEERGSRKMSIDCKNCKEDLSFRNCLPGIILALEENYNVDALILSDFIEIKYSEDDMELFKSLRDVSEDLSRLSFRKTDGGSCEDCEIEPKSMYPSLKKSLLTEHEEFYQNLSNYALKVMKIEGCKDCRKSAKEEITMLGEKVLDFRSKVLMKAYGVLR